MNPPGNHGLVERLPRTLGGACAALSAVVLLVLIPVAYVAYGRSGANGLTAACVAAAVCWFGAIAALILTKQSQGRANPLAGVFAAILLRTGFPLGAALVLNSNNRTLAEAGIFGLILVFYLPTLAAETVLSLRLVKSNSSNAKAL